MKYFTTILVILIVNLTCTGQEYSFSNPVKVNGKISQFRILGKNATGLLVHKYGRKDNIIEAYNNNLSLRIKRNISFEHPNPVVKHIYVGLDNVVIYYFSMDRNYSNLYAKILDARLKPSGEEIFVDSLNGNHASVFDRVKITQSLDHSHILINKIINKKDDVQKIESTMMNDSLVILYRVVCDVINNKDEVKLSNSFTDNLGNAYWLFREQSENRKNGGDNVNKAYLYYYNYKSNVIKKKEFNFNYPLSSEFKSNVDNVNGQVVITGLYSLKNNDATNGIFYLAYDLHTDRTLIQKYENYRKDVIVGITGKDSTKHFGGFYSFSLNKMVLRFDGGVLLIAESRYDNSENILLPNNVPSATPSFRTVNMIYFNDVLVFSLSPAGKLEWSSILYKKQVSEDDDGFFSSYCMASSSDELHFIYNEKIYPKTNVNEYILNTEGELHRKVLFNAAENNVMIVPRLARQVSGNEIIIPSYRRNYLILVKITFNP